MKEKLWNSFDDSKYYSPVSLKNLTELLAIKVDWLKVIRSQVDFEIDENFQIWILRPDFVKATFEFLNAMDDRVFANTFSAGFVFDFHKLYSLYFQNVFRKKLWGIKNAYQRFEQCLTTVREQLPVAFTSLLIKNFINKRMIEDAHDIANRTMKIIIDDVQNDDTLPLEHRNFILEKLKSLKLILGYPEELLNDQNIEDVYKDLNLTGQENLLTLELQTLIFSKTQKIKNLIKSHSFSVERNETTRWIDYTTEDEYITPLYVIDGKNTLCE